jgi:4a-hydroxytetrahydrobiopterin dehydratase
LLLDQLTIDDWLASVTGWSLDGAWLRCDFRFEDFLSAMGFVNRVAAIAEESNHHPDIHIHDWNVVSLALSTHDAGGITEKDISLAKKIHSIRLPEL